jgi:small conductance mechanosensitive channel
MPSESNLLRLQRIAITLLWIVVASLCVTEAFGQGDPDAEPSIPAVEVPALPDITEADSAVPVDKLQLMLKPLRLEELQSAVDHWIGRLQEKTAAVSAAEIAARSAEGDTKQAFLEAAASLREERTALIDRVKVVITAFEAKGGDAEEYNKYIKAIGGVELDVTDASATWVTVRTWMLSKEGGLRWARNIALFVLVLIVTWIVGLIIGGIVRRAVQRLRKTGELLREFLVNVVQKSIYIVGFVLALSMLGLNIGPLLAAIGAAGFVLGFALQGTLSNFASGIMILAYRPFDVGDAVEVAGVLGKVESMTLVSTTIATFDNQQIVVPNNSIWGNVIKNITGKPIRRVDMVFGISYSDDIDKARAILEEIISSHELTLDDPAPMVRMHEMADSSVNFVARPWAKTSDYWDVYWDVMRTVKQRFDAEGISIPFPQRDVHIYREHAD